MCVCVCACVCASESAAIASCGRHSDIIEATCRIRAGKILVVASRKDIMMCVRDITAMASQLFAELSYRDITAFDSPRAERGDSDSGRERWRWKGVVRELDQDQDQHEVRIKESARSARDRERQCSQSLRKHRVQGSSRPAVHQTPTPPSPQSAGPRPAPPRHPGSWRNAAKHGLSPV